MLLKADLKKEQKDKLFEEVKKWIGKASEEKIESLGEKKIAYPIKKEKSGEYTVLSFESDRIGEDLEKRLRIKEEVIRHLLVRV